MSLVGLSSLSPTLATAWSPTVAPAPSAATLSVAAQPALITPQKPAAPSSSTNNIASATVQGNQRFLHITQMPGSLDVAPATYEALLDMQTRGGRMQVWEQAPDNALAEVMGRNASGTTQQGRLAGLGSALLGQVASTGASYRQTVVDMAAVASPDRVQGKAADALWSFKSRPSGSVELSIETRSGARVRLSIHDQREPSASGAGMSVEIVVEGELSVQEREALRALASGFDKAVQGLSGDDPKLDVEELLQFDSKAFTRLELQTEMYGKDRDGNRVLTLSAQIQVDGDRRAVQLRSRDGVVKMATDLRQPAQWGTDAQRANAVEHYLGRIDKAAERGQAKQTLVDLFKSSFAAMHSRYDAPHTGVGLKPGTALHTQPGTFGEEDQGLLTGLADFDASITATTRATNPRRTQELDTFHYTLNQSTHITGSSSRNRAVSQTQTAQLVASYHQSLLVSAAPRLDTTSASQNYLYNKVDDSSSTEVHLAYDDGEAIRATVTQATSRSLHTLRVENNQVTGDSTTAPGPQSRHTDLLPLLKRLQLQRQQDAQEANDTARRERQETLQTWHTQVLQGL